MTGSPPNSQLMRAQVALQASSRSGVVPPFMVMDVMRAAAAREAQGTHVIHMEVGQPGTPAPRSALAAVQRVLEVEPLGYTMALGLPALRERIAKHYLDHYRLAVASDRIIVTTGSSAAFVLAFLALFDVGDKVGLPAPGYPCYRHILAALGQRPVILTTDATSRWMPTGDQVEAEAQRENLRGLVLASPANPTGTMLEPGRLAELAAACNRNGVWLVSDEIYHGLTYERREETALAHSEQAIVINSFSKYFSMTGWRVGWLVVPQRLMRTVERLAQNLYISPPAVAQVAALGAFAGVEELEANKRVYAENRRLLLDELPKMGLDHIVPADGAFYLYVDISALASDSATFATEMLADLGIAVTPGIDFDEERGHRFVRFCYAGKTPDMVEAARRLRGWRRLNTRS
jgi:aspartate/methionine/tyrosine aminotransferase